VGGRYRASITGQGLALGVLSWYRLFPQADGLIIAPGRPLRLGFTAPPHVLFEAPRDVRMVRSPLDQAGPALFFRS
jgi:hypothetical protein